MLSHYGKAVRKARGICRWWCSSLPSACVVLCLPPTVKTPRYIIEDSINLAGLPTEGTSLYHRCARSFADSLVHFLQAQWSMSAARASSPPAVEPLRTASTTSVIHFSFFLLIYFFVHLTSHWPSLNNSKQRKKEAREIRRLRNRRENYDPAARLETVRCARAAIFRRFFAKVIRRGFVFFPFVSRVPRLFKRGHTLRVSFTAFRYCRSVNELDNIELRWSTWTDSSRDAVKRSQMSSTYLSTGIHRPCSAASIFWTREKGETQAGRIDWLRPAPDEK